LVSPIGATGPINFLTISIISISQSSLHSGAGMTTPI
jgi:hypothetical protein